MTTKSVYEQGQEACECRWWSESLEISDVRRQLRGMGESGRAAIAALRGARGRYNWIDVERYVGRGDPDILCTLRDAGANIVHDLHGEHFGCPASDVREVW